MDFLSWIWRPLGSSASGDYLSDPRLELASFGKLKRYMIERLGVRKERLAFASNKFTVR